MVWGRSEVGPKHKEKPGSVLPLIGTIFPRPSPWNPECYQSLETQLHAKWRAVQTKGVWRWARRGGQIELERPHCPGWGVDVRGWRAAAAEAGRWCCASVSGAVWWTRAARWLVASTPWRLGRCSEARPGHVQDPWRHRTTHRHR